MSFSDDQRRFFTKQLQKITENSLELSLSSVSFYIANKDPPQSASLTGYITASVSNLEKPRLHG